MKTSMPPYIHRNSGRTLYYDDALVERWKYGDGSRMSKAKNQSILKMDEMMAYVAEPDQRSAEALCLGKIMRNRGLSLLEASKLLNKARYP